MGEMILFIYVLDFSLRRVRVPWSMYELAPAATATRLEIEKISSFYGGTNNGFLPAIFSSNRLLLPPALFLLIHRLIAERYRPRSGSLSGRVLSMHYRAK
jgi:hypothetical protein